MARIAIGQQSERLERFVDVRTSTLEGSHGKQVDGINPCSLWKIGSENGQIDIIDRKLASRMVSFGVTIGRTTAVGETAAVHAKRQTRRGEHDTCRSTVYRKTWCGTHSPRHHPGSSDIPCYGRLGLSSSGSLSSASRSRGIPSSRRRALM